MPSKKSKKGPTKGSGGKGRRSLEGKGSTLPKEERHWYSDHRRRKNTKAEGGATDRPTGDAAGRSAPRGAPTDTVLVGRNAVVEALRAGIPAHTLYMSNSLDADDRVTEAARLAGDAGIEVREVTRPELDRRCEQAGSPGIAHQGLVLRVKPYVYSDAADLTAAARDADALPLIVALDGVTDPHNLGAVVRSAAAFGAHGVLVPQRRAAGVTAAAWKTSAGALARVPVAQVPNLVRAIEAYQQEGLFVMGLDSGGDEPLDAVRVTDGPLVVVVGAEGRGLSRLVREKCDVVASIPIAGMESLNASVAAGVALYEAVRQRRP